MRSGVVALLRPRWPNGARCPQLEAAPRPWVRTRPPAPHRDRREASCAHSSLAALALQDLPSGWHLGRAPARLQTLQRCQVGRGPGGRLPCPLLSVVSAWGLPRSADPGPGWQWLGVKEQL